MKYLWLTTKHLGMKNLYAIFCSLLFVLLSINGFSQATNVPLPPALSNATANSITLAITSDGNASNTPYSIYCITTGEWVQLNGSLGSSEVMQTAAAWGSVVVTGLNPSTNYCFYVIAYDGNTPLVGIGTQIQATETFSSSSNFSASGSAPTNMFWSPASCSNGGLTYSASGGCTDGYIGKTGNWTNYFGCFLRTPAINCTGQDSVVLNLDITHSYFANQITGDKTRFYMWVDGGYQKATSIKIGGQEVGYSDGNGLWLRFTEARTCVNVSVTYDLTSVSDPSSILFYIEPNNGYNNSNTFDVKLDNISLAGGVPTTACLSTTGGCNPVVITTEPNDVSPCYQQNSQFTVIATGDIAGYQWQIDAGGGNWVDLTNASYYYGVTDPTLYLAVVDASINNTLYRCIVTGTCSGPDTSEVVTLTVDPLPTVSFNPVDTFFCDTDPAYDVSTMVNPTGGYLTASGLGAYNTSFLPMFADIGSNRVIYHYTDTNNCTNRDTAFMVVGEPPSSVGTLAGPTEACKDGIQTFTYTQVSGPFSWSYPSSWTGTADSNSTVATLAPDVSGTISVTQYNTCGAGPATSINVNVLSPPTITVTVGGTSFFATGGVDYTWVDCDNGYTPVGSTGQVYMPADFYRLYAAIGVDANGCTDTSDCVQLLTVGMDDRYSSEINAYPNPTDGYTTITLTDHYDGGSITLYDMNGRATKSFTIQDKATQIEIDMSDLSKGMYTLQLSNENGEVKYFKVARE